jgi:hypothetical protein
MIVVVWWITVTVWLWWITVPGGSCPGYTTPPGGSEIVVLSSMTMV